MLSEIFTDTLYEGVRTGFIANEIFFLKLGGHGLLDDLFYAINFVDGTVPFAQVIKKTPEGRVQ